MQLLALRNDSTTYTRRADAKIGLLKEVIGRVQKGEDVDVKGLLGTGNPEKEKEWEQVIKEIEEEDRLWQANARRRQKKAGQNESEDSEDRRASDKASSSKDPVTEEPTTQPEERTLQAASAGLRRFY
ncbi:MAG: hypothetical protein L6R38_000726 [Xanthoria sp. 2 TBL-2021]|nr:MAG: hypothetical protein L6R38_000726 [Xanthoria sp. 2 TBL-2021]